MGAHFLTLSAESGQTTNQLVYFETGVGEFYHSKSALIDLQIISHDFPKVGSATHGPTVNTFKDTSTDDDNFNDSATAAAELYEVSDKYSSELQWGHHNDLYVQYKPPKT